MTSHGGSTVLETALQALREYEQQRSETATGPPQQRPVPPTAMNRPPQEAVPVPRRNGHLLQAFLHLVPFLGKRVWTPAGPGTLLVIQDYVTVGFDDRTKMRWYDPTAVIPYA
jgi:hypothetical protein